MRQILRLCAFVITIFACFSAVNQVSAQTQVQAGQVIISELRYRGPNGTQDEFVEIYNNTNSPITVQASDASAGWGVTASDGNITGTFCIVPNGTILPARGHFLCANPGLAPGTGYSLSNYPAGDPNCGGVQNGNGISPFGHTTPDASYILFDDVPDGFGIALFTSASISNQNAATRLDAFGFTNSPALFREGAGFATIPSASNEHTLFRNLASGTPKDTSDNAADFLFVATTASIQTQLNGSPGPENRCSPIVNNTTIAVSLLDPSVSSATPPNRVRTTTPEPNGPLGALHVRRTFTNNTGLPVSRLRFRTIDITTRGTCPTGSCADLRVLSSSDGSATLSNGTIVTIRGVRLEESPTGPITPEGGGYNASTSADFITLASPLMPGQSVNIDFKTGVFRGGAFRFFMNIEALNGTQVINPALRKASKK